MLNLVIDFAIRLLGFGAFCVPIWLVFRWLYHNFPNDIYRTLADDARMFVTWVPVGAVVAFILWTASSYAAASVDVASLPWTAIGQPDLSAPPYVFAQTGAALLRGMAGLAMVPSAFAVLASIYDSRHERTAEAFGAPGRCPHSEVAGRGEGLTAGVTSLPRL